jgi:hypothetical protein
MITLNASPQHLVLIHVFDYTLCEWVPKWVTQAYADSLPHRVMNPHACSNHVWIVHPHGGAAHGGYGVPAPAAGGAPQGGDWCCIGLASPEGSAMLYGAPGWVPLGFGGGGFAQPASFQTPSTDTPLATVVTDIPVVHHHFHHHGGGTTTTTTTTTTGGGGTPVPAPEPASLALLLAGVLLLALIRKGKQTVSC